MFSGGGDGGVAMVVVVIAICSWINPYNVFFYNDRGFLPQAQRRRVKIEAQYEGEIGHFGGTK